MESRLMQYFKPSYVESNFDIMLNAIDGYEKLILASIKSNSLKHYISDFLSEKNKKYHGNLCTKWFRIALQRQRPDLIEWFDMIQVLR